MSLRINQKGFSAVGIFLVIAVIAIIGLVSYNVYNKQQSKNDVATNSSNSTGNQATSSGSEVTEAPEINKTADLDTASKALDSINVGATSDEKQLDQDVAAF